MNKRGNQHPIFKSGLTIGQRAADQLTKWAGSWVFILSLLAFMGAWMAINVMMLLYRWDPYPFILLNFVLSTLAALQAPIILMSQNRAAHRDRLRAEYDHRINMRSEKAIHDIQKDLEIIKKKLGAAHK